MSQANIPCDEALSALPGDKIQFVGSTGWETVESGSFEKGPNNQKIYTYMTIEGNKVPYENVTAVQFVDTLKIKPLTQNQTPSKKDILYLVDTMDISSTIKTVIWCVLDGDKNSLMVAQHLIKKELAKFEQSSSETQEEK